MTEKVITILSVIIVFVFSSVITSQAYPTVSLTVSDPYIKTGEMFNVQVWADGDSIGEDLIAFGFDVNTAGTIFSYNGYFIESGFLNASDSSNSYNVSGVGGISDDDVLLATLSFTGLVAGTSSLQVLGAYDGLFYGLFYELNGYDIDFTKDITVHPWSIPEPITGLLMFPLFLSIIITRIKGKHKTA